ncbi:MAG: hypothetical protein AAF694_23255 [Bacteroidota bacterium]
MPFKNSINPLGFLCLLIALVWSIDVASQVPQAFNYQGVARDLSGTPIPMKEIGLRVSILLGEVDGPPEYSEVHSLTTSELGLFAIKIGQGDPQQGNFEDIAWGEGDHYLQIEMDEEQTGSYELIGTSQLLSVPYALQSGNAYWQRDSVDHFLPVGRAGIGVRPNRMFSTLSVGNFDSSLRYRGHLMFLNEEYPSTNSSAVGLITAYGNDIDTTQITPAGRLWAIGSLSTSNQDMAIFNDLAGAIRFGVNRDYEAMTLNSNGFLGIGTTEPASKLQVDQGDVYVNGVGQGVIMRSPDGQCWRITVGNTGTLGTSSVTCPE